MRRKRIVHTLKKPSTMPTKLAKESEMVLSIKQRSILNIVWNGGDEGDRTPGLGVANAALSQLSYIPKHLENVREHILLFVSVSRTC
jgi:hypothetical protein